MRRRAGVGLLCCFALAFAACGGSAVRQRASPSRAGVVLTLRFVGTPADAEIGRSILRNRLAALGVRGTAVDIDRRHRLMFVRLPGLNPRSIGPMKLMTHTAELRFRPVLGVVPYRSPASTTARRDTETTCRNGRAVTRDVAEQQVVLLPDLDHTWCFILGPTVLTGRNIGSARAEVNQSNAEWEVDVHFENNDFVAKVATPYLNQQVAIELDGVVQSAPRINPGITGQDVAISGEFTEEEARRLAIALRYGSLPLRLEFVSAKAAP